MGFCYSQYGLVCDFCGKSKPQDNVKKISCPYGYCQAWACCIECKSKKLHLYSSATPEQKTHKEHCKNAHNEYMKNEQEKQSLLDQGRFLRVCALGHDIDGQYLVKVIFRNKDGQERGYWLTSQAYDNPKNNKKKYDNTTLEDYEIIKESFSVDIYKVD